jgi:hypothetical protein
MVHYAPQNSRRSNNPIELWVTDRMMDMPMSHNTSRKVRFLGIKALNYKG